MKWRPSLGGVLIVPIGTVYVARVTSVASVSVRYLVVGVSMQINSTPGRGGLRSKRNPFRRRRRKRMRVGRAAFTALRMSRKALHNARGELKNHLVNASNPSVTTSGTTLNLSMIARGTATSQRIGDRVSVSGLRVRGLVQRNHAGAPNTHQYFRMLIVKAKTQNLVPLTLVDVFAGAGTAQVPAFTSNKNYIILSDKTYSMSVGGIDTFSWDYWVPIYGEKKKEMRYSAASGDGSSMESGQIVALLLNDTVTASERPFSNHQIRMYFRDV